MPQSTIRSRIHSHRHGSLTRVDGESPTLLLKKAEAATADAPSPSVLEADLGSENIAEFQKTVIADIQTLYQKVEEQGVLSKMSDAGTGEAVKILMTEGGKQAGIPFGKTIGGLSGAAAQEIYNNREKVLEFLGFKSDSVVDGDSNTGSGGSTGDAKSRRK